jgi:AAA domain
VIARCRDLAAGSGTPVLLVVFDSFADFYGAGDSENSSTDMQRLIASMKRIAAALGCVVMANAHTGHGGKDEDGNDKPPPARLRGSSRFKQAWDFELMATGRALVPTKNRYGPLAPPVPYAMESRDGTLVLAAEAAAAQAEAEGWPQAERHPLEMMTAAEEKTFNAVVAYVREHDGEGPLSFRRVDDGTKGRQAVKRQMLDLAVTCGWLASEEMRGGHHGFRYPGPVTAWCVRADQGCVSPVSR